MVRDLTINGRSVGEGGTSVARAAWYGVPVVMIGASARQAIGGSGENRPGSAVDLGAHCRPLLEKAAGDEHAPVGQGRCGVRGALHAQARVVIRTPIAGVALTGAPELPTASANAQAAPA